MLKKFIPLVLSVVCVAQLSAVTPAISTQEMAQATAIAKAIAQDVRDGNMTADQALTEIQAAAEDSKWTLTDKNKKLLWIAGGILAVVLAEEVVCPLVFNNEKWYSGGYIRKGAVKGWNWTKGLFSKKTEAKTEEKKETKTEETKVETEATPETK